MRARRKVRRERLAVALAALVFTLLSVAAEAALTPAQSRGKQIYQKGTSPSGGEIMAVIGTEAVSLPASAAPCGSCHGPDGLGRPEGDVLPTDIRWSELTKVYGHVHDNGRRHPAFDEVSVARLIRAGIDPADNRLDSSMPLYSMSVADMDDLVAYLRHLESDVDPGVDNDRVQVATLLPLAGPQGGLGRAMAQVLNAYFQEVNQRGGVFGRKLDLLAIPFGDTPQATLDTLRSAFDREGIFALVGAYTVGLDAPVLEILRAEGAPLVGPFTLNPGDVLTDAACFYIYSGFAEQAQALVGQALADQARHLVFVGPEGEHIDHLLAAAGEALPKDRQDGVVTLRYPPGKPDTAALADSIRDNAGDALLFLGNRNELEPLLSALGEDGQNPRIYMLSAFVAASLFDAPAVFDNRLFLAFPTLATDVDAAGRAEYQRLAEQHALPTDHLQGQIAALAAAKLLVEGLRGAGRSLSRAGLVEALQALYRYDTGLTPPLTYGPNRRIGARGAHILVVDQAGKTSTEVGEWREVR